VVWNIADAVSGLIKWQTTIVAHRVSSAPHHSHLGVVKVGKMIDSQTVAQCCTIF